MKCYGNREKIRNLRDIAKNAEKRQKLLKQVNSRGHNKVKKFMTIGMLLAMLATPTVARANAPVEFENERLADYDIEEVLDMVDQVEMDVTPEDWDLNISTSYYMVDGVKQPPFRIDISNGTGDKFPIKLLSPEGQEALLDRIESIPTLEEIYITVDLPEAMVERITEAGNYNVKFADTEELALSNANDYVEKGDAIVIYTLANKTREGEWQNYEAASAKCFYFDESIANLQEDELAFLNLDTFHECEEKGNLNSQGKVCIQIPSVVELSTEEAVRLRGKVDYIQIKSADIHSEREAQEVYTLEQYIEVSKGIDAIVEKIDPNASDFEKALTIYYEIGKITEYNETEAYKSYGRRKEVGNLYGVFVENSSVCSGLMESFNAVAQRSGLKSEGVSGFNNGAFVGHAWNQVYINGKWVDIDLTADLKNIQAGKSPEYFGKGYIDYDNMSENHHSDPDERAVIRQEVVEKAYEFVKTNDQKRIKKEHSNSQKTDYEIE